MRFLLSNPRTTKSSFLLGFLLALVFGGERALPESLSSASYAADAHNQVCNCGTRCRHKSCCCGRGSATRGGSEESEPVSSPQGERRLRPLPRQCSLRRPGTAELNTTEFERHGRRTRAPRGYSARNDR